MLGIDGTGSSSAESYGGSSKDETYRNEYRPNASQPLPIIRTPGHKHAARGKNDDDSDDDNDNDDGDNDNEDQGLFSSSPLLFTVSTFSEWGTESTATDEGEESDPFYFDDEASRATTQNRPPAVQETAKSFSTAITSISATATIGNTSLKPVACVHEDFVGYEDGTVLVVVKNKSMLKKWAEAMWGAVKKIFGRRAKGRITESKGGKQN